MQIMLTRSIGGRPHESTVSPIGLGAGPTSWTAGAAVAARVQAERQHVQAVVLQLEPLLHDISGSPCQLRVQLSTPVASLGRARIEPRCRRGRAWRRRPARTGGSGTAASTTITERMRSRSRKRCTSRAAFSVMGSTSSRLGRFRQSPMREISPSPPPCPSARHLGSWLPESVQYRDEHARGESGRPAVRSRARKQVVRVEVLDEDGVARREARVAHEAAADGRGPPPAREPQHDDEERQHSEAELPRGSGMLGAVDEVSRPA